jgi:anti-sigma regulatory factor (Ser/Thr protein kinase)
MDVRVELRGEPSAAGAARDAVCRIGSAVDSDVLEDVRLLVSEVVTNAVRHGGGGRRQHISMDLRFTDDGLIRVEVTDGGPGFTPGRPEPRPDRAGGWGLVLLDRLADRWGVDLTGDTMVWFELGPARSHQADFRRIAVSA